MHTGVKFIKNKVENVQEYITKIRLFKYIKNFTIEKISDKKNSDIFHIPAQNIDCGYSLEPPCRNKKH